MSRTCQNSRAMQGVGFVAGWRGSLGVRHAWSYGFAMAKLGDSPTEGSTWSGPSFYYLADSGMGGVGESVWLYHLLTIYIPQQMLLQNTLDV